MARKGPIKDYIAAVKVIGCSGDINFLDYGGTLVVENQGQIEGWHFEPNDEQETEIFLSRFELEQFKLVGDVESQQDVYVNVRYENSWPYAPSSYKEWWAKDLKGICNFTGRTEEEFWDDMCSDNPMSRVFAHDDIGSYHGYSNLTGGEEDKEQVPEWRRRLSLPCYRARQKGIDVRT